MRKVLAFIVVIVLLAVVLTVVLYPSQPGYIKVATPGAEILFRSFWRTLRVNHGMGNVALRPRTYKPYRVSLALEKQGDRWNIYSSGPWGKLAKIRVKSDETTVLKLGPPFVIKSIVDQKGSRVSISPLVIGQAGEHYSPRVMKNGRQLPAPGVKIVDEAGKVLASGKFAYG